MPNDVSYVQVQDMLESLRNDLSDQINAAGGGGGSMGGPGDLTPIGPWPVTVRLEKGKPVVGLKCAVPAGMKSLHIVLEEFTGAGPVVTVVRKISGHVQMLTGSATIFSFDFPERLDYNSSFGCIRLVAVMPGGPDVHNPAVDFPDSPRNLTDYLPGSTFTLTAAFNPPLGAREILIREAGLTPGTKKFEAYDILRLFGPLTNAGTGQSLRAANVDMLQPRVTELSEQTTLNGAITNVVTTIILTDATVGVGFNQGDQVFIVDANGTGEIVLLGVKAVNTFSGCTRGIEGTPAVSHLSAVKVFRLTKVAHDPKAKNLTDADLDQVATNPDGVTLCGYVDQAINGLAPGTPCVWIGTHASAAGQKTQSTGAALFFWAGDVARPTANIPELTTFTGTAVLTDPNDGRGTEIFAQFTQPTPSASRPTAVAPTGLPVALEKIQVVRDATTIRDTDKLNRAELTSPGLKTINLGGFKTKKFTNHVFSLIINGYGAATNSRSVTVGVNTGDWTGGDVQVPTLVTNPVTGTTGPTVQERHSKIDVTGLAANATVPGAASVDIFQVILSSNASMTTTAGDPTIGVNGVLNIKQGQHVTFNLSYLQPLTGDVYCYYRIHNKSGVVVNGSAGWSLWSAATNQHGYSRPIQDFIGSGVPVLPIRLEFDGTGSGASTTTFTGSVLDTTDYQTMITAGIGFHIMILSLTGADRIRKITAYNSGTRVFTVSPAWSGTPGASVSYQIHRGLAAGEASSAVANTTTTVNLGTAGAAFADHVFEGGMVYMPTQPDGTDDLRGDRIRKIVTHAGGVITFDSAVAAALATGACYAISLGSFGSQFINSMSGLIAGTPIRVWYDSAANTNVVEVRMPTGETAFSIQAIEIVGWRQSNGKKRIPFLQNVSVNPSYAILAPSGYTPAWTIRLQNLFRDGGSDGFSSRSYYVQGFVLAGAPPTTYNPDSFPTSPIDFQNTDSYPTQRYPLY